MDVDDKRSKLMKCTSSCDNAETSRLRLAIFCDSALGGRYIALDCSVDILRCLVELAVCLIDGRGAWVGKFENRGLHVCMWRSWLRFALLTCAAAVG